MQRKARSRKLSFTQLESRRLLAPMVPDPAFSGDGLVIDDLYSGSVAEARSSVAYPDGRITVATASGTGLRFNPDGALDPTVGTEGVMTVPGGVSVVAAGSGSKLLVVTHNGYLRR